MSTPVCSFIQISDSHIGPDPSFVLYGKNTRKCAQCVIDRVNGFDSPVDFVVHTGDVLNRPRPESLSQAREVFSTVRFPLYMTTGNHDTSLTTDSLLQQPVNRLHHAGCSYWFERNGCRFVALDTRGPDEIDPHGVFDTDREKALKSALAGYEGQVVVFTHFPPLPLDSVWHDRDMLMIEGDRMHKVLKKSSARIAGVFFGHLHRHIMIFRDGIPYVSAASTFCQFGALPSDKQTRFEQDAPVSFNYVSIMKDSVVVKSIDLSDRCPCE